MILGKLTSDGEMSDEDNVTRLERRDVGVASKQCDPNLRHPRGHNYYKNIFTKKMFGRN